MNMRLLTTSICAAVLVACGGGSSSGDTQAPTVALTAPADLATGLNGAVLLTATASDNVGVSLVEFEVDGVAVGSDSSPPFQAALIASQVPDGQHVVRARARDVAGNFSGWSSATVRVDNGAVAPEGFTRNEGYVSGLLAATAFVQSPDGRLFIAEQDGTVRIWQNGVLQSTPFLRLAVDSSGERGLLGIALDPDFAVNAYVYVYYTTPAGDPLGVHNRVSRFTATGIEAAPGSEFIVLELPPLGSTVHNGGAIHFGADGKLFVAVGDNALGAVAQDLASPFGKLLRINADGSFPIDNPFFADRPGVAPRAVWAYGLRNPFTFAVQPGTGRIHINDVGLLTWEEIDLGAAGANYGWPTSEGPDNIGPGITAPLFTYNHADSLPPGSGPGGFFVGASIAGGTFYPATGPFPPSFRGNYYFSDFVNRFIGRLDLANGAAAYAFGKVSDSPVDMLVASDGSLLVLTRSGVTRFSAP